MNIKFKFSIIVLAAALMQSPLQAQEAVTPVPVDKLKDEDSFDTIYRSYVEVQIDKSTTYETKAALKMRFLVIAHNYINTHTRPEGKVWTNMSPPDGSMSGIAAEAIKDPKTRAKYIKPRSRLADVATNSTGRPPPRRVWRTRGTFLKLGLYPHRPRPGRGGD